MNLEKLRRLVLDLSMDHDDSDIRLLADDIYFMLIHNAEDYKIDDVLLQERVEKLIEKLQGQEIAQEIRDVVSSKSYKRLKTSSFEEGHKVQDLLTGEYGVVTFSNYSDYVSVKWEDGQSTNAVSVYTLRDVTENGEL